jgi:hypothetical protein
VHIHPLACGRVGLSGPGRALRVTLSAPERATLPVGEFSDLASSKDAFFVFRTPSLLHPLFLEV